MPTRGTAIIGANRVAAQGFEDGATVGVEGGKFVEHPFLQNRDRRDREGGQLVEVEFLVARKPRSVSG